MIHWFKKLFSGGRGRKQGAGKQEKFPLMAREAWCSVCHKSTRFTRVWRCAHPLSACSACGCEFDMPELIYDRIQPTCPKCEEPMEQPGFDYGLCDCCGSKFELVEGTKPGLLPNKYQRAEMRKHGRSWSPS
jgi:hypothetical protein